MEVKVGYIAFDVFFENFKENQLNLLVHLNLVFALTLVDTKVFL